MYKCTTLFPIKPHASLAFFVVKYTPIGQSLCPASVGGTYPSMECSDHTRTVKSFDPAATHVESSLQSNDTMSE